MPLSVLLFLLSVWGSVAQDCGTLGPSASNPPTDCLNVDKYLVQMGFRSTNGCCCSARAVAVGTDSTKFTSNVIACEQKRVTDIDLTAGPTTPGTMPERFDLPELQYLQLRNLSLEGMVPDISANKKLRWFDLSNNKLTGFVNPDFSPNIGVSDFTVSSNPISAPFPPSLAALSFVVYLRIDKTNITGEFPNLSNQSNLRTLNISCSGVTGRLDGRLPPYADEISVNCNGESKVYYCNSTLLPTFGVSRAKIPVGSSAQCPVSNTTTSVGKQGAGSTLALKPTAFHTLRLVVVGLIVSLLAPF
ncbi:hypothetical protein M427DRAFT_52582 [Gonapodya prolifera JEL478]|uniref:L domain-like protein n=1 Tax=Gonapodya prolifera (strain JEL478) TaxID=1344416 RepID=A0A139ASG5_GONPJ|nr:hypothetical protein M427DRAFT_52582 [Gonapodya prolifera JEL478]|eukprot:KXS19686.1 hypothetical protein M427DRAFT_52582 [Gonapodya prolifera JEL478]